MTNEELTKLYQQEKRKSCELRKRLCLLCRSIEWDKESHLAEDIQAWWDTHKAWFEAHEAWQYLNEDERRAIKNHIDDLPIEDEE